MRHVVSIRTRRTYSAEDRQISRPTSAITGIAVGFTIATVVCRLSAAVTSPGLAAPLVQTLGALLFLAVLVVHLLVIGRYRLLELDLRVRRNVQYLMVSSAWTALIVGAGLFFWWELMHLELPLPNVRLTSDALEVLPTPVDAARRAVIEKGVLIAAAVLFAYAFRALLKRGHRFLAEQYYQEGYDYRRATKEFSEVMGPRMDLDGLADGLLTVIDRLMPVKRAGVLFVQGDRLVSSKRSIGFDSNDWDVFCTGCVEEAVAVLRAARVVEMDTEYAPPRLRLALRRAQIHHLYPIGGHDELRGVVFIGEKLSEAPYTADDFAFLGVIASQAALLVENAFLYENLAAQERVRQELAIARRIQLESLPQRPPRIEGLDVYGVSVPAQEVGGDYFDYLDGDDATPGRDDRRRQRQGHVSGALHVEAAGHRALAAWLRPDAATAVRAHQRPARPRHGAARLRHGARRVLRCAGAYGDARARRPPAALPLCVGDRPREALAAARPGAWAHGQRALRHRARGTAPDVRAWVTCSCS